MNTADSLSFDLIPMTGRGLGSLCAMAEETVALIEQLFSLRIADCVVDFTVDHLKKPWFVNLKSFTVEEKICRNPPEQVDLEFVSCNSSCKMCGIAYHAR